MSKKVTHKHCFECFTSCNVFYFISYVNGITICPHFVIFTALHGMQTLSYDEISVRLSVCLSNACIVTKRKKDMFRFLYHTKEHLS